MSVILEAINRHDPDKIALVSASQSVTYGALAKAVEDMANGLSNVRVLGIALDNGTEWLLWDLAAVKAGITCVPLPPFFSTQQRDHIIQAAGVSHIITPGGLTETGAAESKLIPDGTAKITFTSGTTGTPKGVCLSQDGIEQVTQSIVDVLGADLAERHLPVMPLSVLLENVAGVYATILAGGTAHIYSLNAIGMANPFQPDFVQLAHTISTHKITSAILVPELLRGLMQAVAQTKLELPSLKFIAVGGSKVAPELVVQTRALGLPVYEGYGLSECASVVSLNTPQNDRPGTVGKVLPHIDLAVAGGEITIRNPAFLGYLGEAHEGIFRTGDLGHVDDNGFLHIDGRKKNVLITSHGRNISPEWVESVLLAQPQILQAVVFGDAQPYLSALIVPAHETADMDQAVKTANEALPEYAQIKAFHSAPPFTVQDSTLTGTGRPKREEIFRKYQSQITKEYDHELLRTAG
ncbi:MAG: AMP-binding protein [Rhodospirillales bacterium]|nr:AMP-binding protein [Rhodospirillales bacterium]MCB9996896.1 AMP-binding protein [Rhodospirillales bacterium]